MNVIIPMHWHATLTCCRDDDDFWNSRSELQIFSNCIEKGPQKNLFKRALPKQELDPTTLPQTGTLRS